MRGAAADALLPAEYLEPRLFLAQHAAGDVALPRRRAPQPATWRRDGLASRHEARDGFRTPT